MRPQIPDQYPGQYGKLHYVALERTRRAPLIFAYLYLAIVVGGAFVYLFTHLPPKESWLIETCEAFIARFDLQNDPPMWEAMAGALTMLLGVVSPIAPLLLAMWWASPRKSIAKFTGRCLNCGEPRLSDFLDECSACQSSFVEQAAYRQLAGVGPLNPKHYNALNQPLDTASDHTSRLHSKTFIAAGALMFIPVFVPMLFQSKNEISDSVFCITELLVGLLLAGIGMQFRVSTELKRVRENYQRLRGCCLNCGTPRDEEALECTTCGSGLLAQRSFFPSPPARLHALEKPVPDLSPLKRQLLRRMILPAAALLLVAAWTAMDYIARPAERSEPPRLSFIVAMGYLLVWSVWLLIAWTPFRLQTIAANLSRVAGRCLVCESPLAGPTKTCPSCGWDAAYFRGRINAIRAGHDPRIFTCSCASRALLQDLRYCDILHPQSPTSTPTTSK